MVSDIFWDAAFILVAAAIVIFFVFTVRRTLKKGCRCSSSKTGSDCSCCGLCGTCTSKDQHRNIVKKDN